VLVLTDYNSISSKFASSLLWCGRRLRRAAAQELPDSAAGRDGGGRAAAAAAAAAARGSGAPVPSTVPRAPPARASYDARKRPASTDEPVLEG
jgi:hypothetical protein